MDEREFNQYVKLVKRGNIHLLLYSVLGNPRVTPKIFRALVTAGMSLVPFSAAFYPPLHFLAMARDDPMVRSIIALLVREYGFDPNEPNPKGGRATLPLALALYAGHPNAAKALVLAGADPMDPRLDEQVANPDGKALLAEMRTRRTAADTARSRIAEEGIKQYAERQGLAPAMGPGIGPNIADWVVGKKGRGRKTQKVRRHRKRPHRKSTRRT